MGGAKAKLNAAYLNGALVVALLAALATQSATIFLVTLAALIATSLIAGELRR